ncbi:MAG: hypothetical protein SGBAC_013227, partial [Bacillariaceae sp.]
MMWANHLYLNVLQKGNHKLLFVGPGEPRPPDSKKPNIKWQFSKARRLLVEDVKNQVVKFDENDEPIMELNDIYAMHPEYSDYLLENFDGRLQSIWKKTKENVNRAAEDLAAIEEFIACNELSYVNKFGMIQWQGSDAQEQALVDLEANAFLDFRYRHIFDNNTVYTSW